MQQQLNAQLKNSAENSLKESFSLCLCVEVITCEPIYSVTKKLQCAFCLVRSVNTTKSDTAVFQQVAEVIKQGSLIVTADTAKITQESTAAGNHLWEGNFLSKQHKHKERQHRIN